MGVLSTVAFACLNVRSFRMTDERDRPEQIAETVQKGQPVNSFQEIPLPENRPSNDAPSEPPAEVPTDNSRVGRS